jgi:hypothetical protein
MYFVEGEARVSDDVTLGKTFEKDKIEPQFQEN